MPVHKVSKEEARIFAESTFFDTEAAPDLESQNPLLGALEMGQSVSPGFACACVLAFGRGGGGGGWMWVLRVRPCWWGAWTASRM
jgi:hypothetical protein